MTKDNAADLFPMTKSVKESAIAQCAAIVTLIFGLTEYATNYHALTRFVVCGLCAYLAVAVYRQEKFNLVWMYGAIAVLFNPIAPVRLDRAVWPNVSIVVIVLIGLMLWKDFNARRVPKSANNKLPRDVDALADFLGVRKRLVTVEEQSAIRECKCCNQMKRTQFVALAENVSYITERQERTIAGYFCFVCLTKTFIVFETKTLLGTWWGMVGILVGPGYLLWNLIEYLRQSYRFATTK